MKQLIEDGYYMLVSMLMLVKSWVSNKAYELRTEGASHFVEILIAIIIVIAVGAVFKDQISAFITSIVGESTTKAKALF